MPMALLLSASTAPSVFTTSTHCCLNPIQRTRLSARCSGVWETRFGSASFWEMTWKCQGMFLDVSRTRLGCFQGIGTTCVGNIRDGLAHLGPMDQEEDLTFCESVHLSFKCSFCVSRLYIADRGKASKLSRAVEKLCAEIMMFRSFGFGVSKLLQPQKLFTLSKVNGAYSRLPNPPDSPNLIWLLSLRNLA